MDLYKEIKLAQKQLYNIILPTPLIENLNLSKQYGAAILLKREDLQVVSSFKIRGAYNKINSLTAAKKKLGIICASAGNHAQSVAYCCHLLKIMGKIYMPTNTPKKKVKKIQRLGKNYVQIVLAGDFFDEACAIALGDASIHRKAFIHPFNDLKIIAGQGTVGIEVLEQYQKPIDYVFVPIEGGGLAAGLSTVFRQLSPNTKIIGVSNQDNTLVEISTKKNDNLISNICKKNLTTFIKIPKGKVCSTMLKLFNDEGMTIEPAGVLSIAALDSYAKQIEGKNVVCIISSGTKDIEREAETREHSLIFEGLVHYFLIQSTQSSRILKELINHVLGPDDDVTYFQSVKKHSCETESVLLRLELKNPNNILAIKANMVTKGFQYQNLNEIYDLFSSIISLENAILERKTFIDSASEPIENLLISTT